MGEELKKARAELLTLHQELSAAKAALKLAAPKEKKPAPPSKNKLTLSGDPNVPVPEQVAEALRSNASRVLDLFRSWDANGDGEISRKEFHKSIPALGLDVAKSDIDALFEQWDSDGGGSLAYKELRKILNTRPAKKMALSGEGSIVDQLSDALKSNASRVFALFQSWDQDGDGEISRKEFHRAMPALGFDVPKADIDALFNRWDTDGGGSLAYRELKKLLTPGAPKRGNAPNGLKKVGNAMAAVSGMTATDNSKSH